MKKIILALIVLFMLSGCSYVNEYLPYVEKYLPLKQDKVSANHIEELDKKFEYKETTAARNYLEAIYSYLNRGDTIEVISEDERYYYFKDYNLLLGVDKRLVRNVEEEEFTGFTGYTKANTSFYPDVNMMDGTITHTFNRNDQVNVIDLMNDRYYIEYNGEYGFVYKSQISKNKFVYVAPKVETKTETYDYSGGGGGGSTPTTNDNDGEDIVTKSAYEGIGAKVISLASDKLFDGVIRIYNCEAYIKVYDRLEEIKYTGEDDKYLTVLVEGYTAKVKQNHTNYDEEVYEDFYGYAYGNTYVYADYYLDHSVRVNKKNDKLHVIDCIEGVYIIELDDGTIGYMNTKNLSKTYLVTYVAPKVEETPTYSGGGGGGGSTSSGDVYTPPVL